jgi:hypothetical protein
MLTEPRAGQTVWIEHDDGDITAGTVVHAEGRQVVIRDELGSLAVMRAGDARLHPTRDAAASAAASRLLTEAARMNRVAGELMRQLARPQARQAADAPAA